MLASLNHPGIAAIYGFEESNGTQALVLELVEGSTLAEIIARRGTAEAESLRSRPRHSEDAPARGGGAPRGLDMDEALTIARQIAEALEAAHDQDIVHRDLKPANIKLRPDGTVKVLDFGLAKALEPASTTTSPASVTNSPTLTTPLGVTGVGVLLGTAAYMAPEQAAGRPADKRSDVWSFGVVVWEMLTGRRLFEGESVSHTLADVLRAPIPFDALPADTPPAMHRLLHRCLERDRKRRLRDMGDARIEIDEAISAPRDDGRRPPPMVTSRLRQSLVLASAIAVSGLVTAGAMAWVMRERLASPAAPMRFQIPPPENADVLFGAMQLSPDGRLLAFSARGPDGVSSLWIRSLDSLEARPLEGTETTLASFFWSPDSRQLAFGTGWSGRLKKIDVSGGPAQTLCEIRSGSAVAGGSWNRDGVIIFGDPNGGPLVRVSASGGQCTALTRVDGIGQHIFPVFLPDGQHFLYLVSSFEPAPEVRTSDVYLGSLSEDPGRQQLKKILSTDYEVTYAPTERPGIGRLLFLREGTLFAQDFDNRRFELTGQAVPIVSDVGTTYNKAFVTVSSNGHLVYQTSASNNFGLAWLDRQGQVLGRVGDPLFPRTLAITKDGRHAAYESYAGGLMLIDLERGTTTRLAPGSGTGFAWSPDGTCVFVANDGLNLNLSLLSANGAKNAERLLELDELMWPLDWSGDDRFLLYRIDNAKTKGDLWALPLDGDKKPFPVVQTADDERDGRFSPDGRWIAYTSNRSGKNEVYVRPFRGPSSSASSEAGGTWTISKGGGNTMFAWGADGKELWYLAPDSKIMAVAVTTTRNAFRAGEPRLLLQPPPGALLTATNGERFLTVLPATQGKPAPFNVVLNWPATLKQ